MAKKIIRKGADSGKDSSRPRSVQSRVEKNADHHIKPVKCAGTGPRTPNTKKG